MLETELKDNFTLGIKDDLNNTSLKEYEYKGKNEWVGG